MPGATITFPASQHSSLSGNAGPDRVSQTLTGRIRRLTERHATPLPRLTGEVATFAACVDGHLKKMGFQP